MLVLVVVAGVLIWRFTGDKNKSSEDKSSEDKSSEDKSSEDKSSEDKSSENKSSGGPYKKEAVATDTEKCSAIGREILDAKGSAVDSAIAAMFCLGVINMHSSGVGGGGVMMVYNRTLKEAKVIDFRETAPATTTPNMFQPGSDDIKYGLYLVNCPLPSCS